MRKGVLYCKTKMSNPDRSTMQLVLQAFRKQALQGCHDDLGHLRNRMDDRSLEGSLLLARDAH